MDHRARNEVWKNYVAGKNIAHRAGLADAEFTGEGRGWRKCEEKGEGRGEGGGALRQDASGTNQHWRMNSMRVRTVLRAGRAQVR